MRFTEKERAGEVLGNKVKAKPVSWSAMRALGEAQKSGDEVAIVEEMAKIVSEFVMMEDGDGILVNEISIGALRALFDFAVGTSEEHGIADFTSTRSTEAQGEENPPNP